MGILAARRSENLMANGSFERGMIGWRGWVDAIVVTETAFAGSRSIRIMDTGPQPHLLVTDPELTVQGGARYQFRAAIKTRLHTAVAWVELKWRTRDRALLRTDFFGHVMGVADWARYETPVLVAPYGSVSVEVRLIAYGGTVFFDDVQCLQVE